MTKKKTHKHAINTENNLQMRTYIAKLNKGRDRQTDRHTNKQTDSQTVRQTDRQTDRQRRTVLSPG